MLAGWLVGEHFSNYVHLTDPVLRVVVDLVGIVLATPVVTAVGILVGGGIGGLTGVVADAVNDGRDSKTVIQMGDADWQKKVADKASRRDRK